MAKIAVVIGSVRPNRIGAQVAEWVAGKAASVEGVEAQVVDLRELDLPLFAEELPTAMAAPKEPKAQPWLQAISEADGVLFVTPEYNHSIPGSLKNALDFLTRPRWLTRVLASSPTASPEVCAPPSSCVSSWPISRRPRSTPRSSCPSRPTSRT